jgi:hypothetical protein
MKRLLLILTILASSLPAAEGFRLRHSYVEGKLTITKHGTAFAFSPRKLLTAAHNVLENGKALDGLIVEVGERWLPCSVVKFNAEADIAILSVKEDVPSFQFGEDPDEGSAIVLSGSKRGQEVKREAGKITNAYTRGLLFVGSVRFDHGMSGSPVLKDGKVVGMAVAGIPKDDDIDHSKFCMIPVSALRYYAK